MDIDELLARESIRDLIARYNANGDSGRFAQVLELFAPDAVMDIDDGRLYTGHDEILTIFTGTRDRDRPADAPAYVRHHTATHQIDLVDTDHATSRSYFQVITAVGLDHWGRYLDEFRRDGGRWRFTRRRVVTDGWGPASTFR